jgi:UDP-N-acetylmuramate dehydrogenase
VYPLSNLHTFALPTLAQDISVVHHPEDLKAALKLLQDQPFYVLGEGSNTVFLEDYQGTVLKIAFTGIKLQHTSTHFRLTVGAGENWHQLVHWCMQNNIYGLENLALIPGSVGAAPIQNIGAYGVEVESFVYGVEYFDLLDGMTKILDHQTCAFSYRDSLFKSELAQRTIITQVILDIPKDNQVIAHYGDLAKLSCPTPEDIFSQVVAIRQKKLPDPKVIGNAGSFFKNPVIDKAHFLQLQQTWPSIPSYTVDNNRVKIPAAWLIDTLGFKGKKMGGIGCHAKQPLVLTNDGTGTGQLLLQLARKIHMAVKNKFSISLDNEVRLIGKNGPINL